MVFQARRTFLGPVGARQSAFTVQFRGFAANGIELNFGLGYSAVSYEYQTILRIGLVDGRAVPIAPQLHRERYGVGAIRTEVFIGKGITRGLSLKGGFTYDLTGDMHPFQPMVLLALRVG